MVEIVGRAERTEAERGRASSTIIKQFPYSGSTPDAKSSSQDCAAFEQIQGAGREGGGREAAGAEWILRTYYLAATSIGVKIRSE